MKIMTKRLLARVKKVSQVSVTINLVQMLDKFSINSISSMCHTIPELSSNTDQSAILTTNLKSFKGTQACHTISISTIFLKRTTQVRMRIKNNNQHLAAAANRNRG